ncbi:MAG: hypothetical protein HN590_13345 [Calditrichaeota bacterium]|nr:hypothetical protein [Calditrichota bacterium]
MERQKVFSLHNTSSQLVFSEFGTPQRYQSIKRIWFMMRISCVMIYVLTVVFLCVNVSFAQPNISQESTYGTDRGETCMDHIQTADGGFVFIGQSSNPNNGESQMVAVKVDADGEQTWLQTYGGEDGEQGDAILQLEDGGYALAGNTWSYGEGWEDCWLVRVNADGEELWSQTYGGDRPDALFSILPMDDGGFSLCGFTWSFGAGEKDYYLIRTNADGNAVWTRTYGGEECDYARDHVRTADGGFAIGGYTTSFGGEEKNMGLCKVDENGELEWWQAFGGDGNDDCFSLIQSTDNGYVLAGYTEPEEIGFWDIFILKTDSEGEEEWSVTVNMEDNEMLTDIIQLDDEGYLATGYVISNEDGGADCYFIRLDRNGEVKWEMLYGHEYADECHSVIVTPEGYSFAGFSVSVEDMDLNMWHIQTEVDPFGQFAIPLGQGWNLISSPKPPPEPNIESVWGEIVDRENLLLTKNHQGQFFLPSHNFNNMADWDVLYGYFANLATADTLAIISETVPENTPIHLRQGWSIVSYLPSQTIDARQAFESIADQLLLAKDGNGRFYSPQNDFSNMQPLRQGLGYQVKSSDVVELIWMQQDGE